MILSQYCVAIVKPQKKGAVKAMDKQSKEKFKNVANGRIREKVAKDIEENLEKFRDPVVLAELVYLLTEERENTNRILKTLLARIEALEETLGAGKGKKVLLPETDERIVEIVRGLGKATAEDVQKKLKYKGKNAASARMNRLCNMGLLQKKQVGRKVFFLTR